MTTLAEYNTARAKLMTEKQLQDVIVALATHTGWLVYHTHDSRRSQPGYPDLHLVHPVTGRSLFRELKTQTGKLRPDQVTWIAGLESAGYDVAIWRPIDWFNQTIDNTLAPPTPTKGNS